MSYLSQLRRLSEHCGILRPDLKLLTIFSRFLHQGLGSRRTDVKSVGGSVRKTLFVMFCAPRENRSATVD